MRFMNATDTCPNATLAAGVAPGQAYLDFNLALFVLYTLFAAGTLGAWWWLVRQGRRPDLAKRSFVLVAVSGAGSVLEFIIMPLREYLGPASFPCDAYLWLNVFLLQVLVGPLVLQIALFKYRADFNQLLGALDFQSVAKMFADTDAVRKRRTTYAPQKMMQGRKSVRVTGSGSERSPRASDLSLASSPSSQPPAELDDVVDAEHRFSERHAAMLVVFGMLLPAIVLGLAMSFSSPVYFRGCLGCSASTNEMVVYALETFYLIGWYLWFAYQTRTLTDACGMLRRCTGYMANVRADPWRILSDTRRALVFVLVVGLLFLALVSMDPFALTANKQFHWGWIACLAIGGVHVLFCVVPLCRTGRAGNASNKQGGAVMQMTRDQFVHALGDAKFHAKFVQYCVGTFAIENIKLWDAVRYLVQLPVLKLDTKSKDGVGLKRSFDELFMYESSMLEINISAEERAAYESEPDWRIALTGVRDAIVGLMYTDTLPRFLALNGAAEEVQAVAAAVQVSARVLPAHSFA